MKNNKTPSEVCELRSAGVLLCAIGVLVALMALGRSYIARVQQLAQDYNMPDDFATALRVD